MSETSVVAEEWGDFKLRADWREGLRSWVSGVYCVLSSSVMDGARGAGAGRLPSKQRGAAPPPGHQPVLSSIFLAIFPQYFFTRE